MTIPASANEILLQAQTIAKLQGRQWDGQLEHILLFCIQYPTFFPKKAMVNLSDGLLPGSSVLQKYLTKYLSDYYREREGTIALKESATRPDLAVDTVLSAFAQADAATLTLMSIYHRQSMAAENLIGKLLERYIASAVEPLGWIWCCGETVWSVDFLRPNNANYHLLQIKNRTNSENSSSAAIRMNRSLNIQVWKRINAATGQTYWDVFPENEPVAGVRPLSEEGFHAFIVQSANKLTVKFE